MSCPWPGIPRNEQTAYYQQWQNEATIVTLRIYVSNNKVGTMEVF